MNLNPAAFSKVNWTQVVGAVATLGALVGLDLSPERQVEIVAAIALTTQAATVVFRTFFTGKAPE